MKNGIARVRPDNNGNNILYEKHFKNSNLPIHQSLHQFIFVLFSEAEILNQPIPSIREYIETMIKPQIIFNVFRSEGMTTRHIYII